MYLVIVLVVVACYLTAVMLGLLGAVCFDLLTGGGIGCCQQDGLMPCPFADGCLCCVVMARHA
jgi:hypothetical protein